MALSGAQQRLVQLQRQLASDRRILASQLIADYESPTPNLVDVIVESRGWEDLVNKVSNLSTIAKSNARTMRLVITTRAAVAAEARRLAKIKIRRQQTTTAVRVERDDIAQLRLSIVDRELRVAHDRSAKRSQLTKLQKTLSHEATVLDREAAAARDASLPVVPPPGGCVDTPFVPHGGSTGFFPAPGTNYSVNQEPIIAARLDALGRALGLHLIGISGLPQPGTLGRGRRVRRRSPHARRGLRHAGRRRRARGDARGVLPHAPVPRGARGRSHPGAVTRDVSCRRGRRPAGSGPGTSSGV